MVFEEFKSVKIWGLEVGKELNVGDIAISQIDNSG